MARPLNTRYFEVPLPKNLPPNLEWMRQYHSNSEQLFSYLTDKGAGSTAYHSALRCLTDLRTYLLTAEKQYSPEAAIAWFEEKDTRDKGTRVTLDRLSDLFQFGTVQPVHAFPAEIPYRNELCAFWKTILDKYISSLSQKKNWKEAIRSHVARFLHRIQHQGIISPEEITFEVLEDYLQNDSHISASSASIYAHAIGKFIQYMADQQLCGHGLGWYPFFYLHGRVSNLTNLTTDQIERIEAARAESQEFSSEEFAAVIPDFVDHIISLGYSKTQQKVAKYSLLNLLLFLEMHELGYHPVIASIWLEIEHNRINSSGWKQSRRILNLFEVYTVEGDIIPQMFFREKPLLSDGLPSWCKNRLDAFISLKIREGWEKSTICMFRSSITRFCIFLCSEGFSSFSDIDASTVAAFNRADKHLTAEGKNAYNIRIRSFLQFLERNQDIPYGLHLALYCKSANSEKTVMTLTDEELADIQKAHTFSHTPMQLRNSAMVLLGAKMGIRASDIVEIKLQDIDWDRQSISFIQEKTVHEVRLPMPVIVGNAIFLYLKNGRPKTDSDYLFVKSRIPFDRLSRGACLKALRDILPNRNVPRSGFHVTRKTFATKQLQNGTARQTISELLGQRDTSSLNHYLNLDADRMYQCPLTLEETNLCMRGDRYAI